MRVYNRALSPAEVAYLHGTQAPPVITAPDLLDPGFFCSDSASVTFTWTDVGAANYWIEVEATGTLDGDVGRFALLLLELNEWRGASTLDASFYGNDATREGTTQWSTDAARLTSVRCDRSATRVSIE